jgi:hypothetical protein
MDSSNSSVSESIEDQLEMMNDLLDKSRQLQTNFETLHTANSTHLLVRVTREQATTLNDALTCAICKGMCMVTILLPCNFTPFLLLAAVLCVKKQQVSHYYSNGKQEF